MTHELSMCAMSYNCFIWVCYPFAFYHCSINTLHHAGIQVKFLGCGCLSTMQWIKQYMRGTLVSRHPSMLSEGYVF